MKSFLKSSALVACLSISSMSHAAILFQDDFSDSGTAGWSFYGNDSNEWAVADGKLQSQLTSSSAYDGTLGFAIIDGISNLNNFRLEADVQVVGNIINRSPNNDFGHVGMVWGFTDPSLFNTSYLRTHSNHVTTWSRDPAFSGEAIFNVGNTTNSPTINDHNYHMSLDVDYILKEMTISLDAYSYTLSGANFDQYVPNNGQIGLIQWGERVSYDNVILTSKVPEPSIIALFSLGLFGLGFMRREKI